MTALSLAGWAAAVPGAILVLVLRTRLARRELLVARACHELRAPLAAARLALAAMQRRGEIAPARAAGLDGELRRAGVALDDLAGGAPVLREEPIPVAELLREQIGVWDLVARALGAELVLGDRVRLAQAIGNLISNAVQHGGGRIELAARRTGDRVRIEVADEGPGLPAGVVALAERREAAGRHGHGLAVAATVARVHGGRLSPAPSVRGTRIGLELPALGLAR